MSYRGEEGVLAGRFGNFTELLCYTGYLNADFKSLCSSLTAATTYRFLAFVCVYDLTGAVLSDVIMKEISGAGLQLDKLIGLGFDGASNMAGYPPDQEYMSRSICPTKGCVNGAQARIREKFPHVTYTHCASHALNLAAVEGVKELSSIKEKTVSTDLLTSLLTETFTSTLQTLSILLSRCMFVSVSEPNIYDLSK